MGEKVKWFREMIMRSIQDGVQMTLSNGCSTILWLHVEPRTKSNDQKHLFASRGCTAVLRQPSLNGEQISLRPISLPPCQLSGLYASKANPRA